MSMNLAQLWTESLRQQLHNPSVWCLDDGIQGANDTPSLLYMGTGAGAVGAVQLKQFLDSFPASQHFLAQSERFDNELHSKSLLVDGRRLCEEIVIHFLHHERLDYLLPGIAPTQRSFSLAFSISAEFDDKVNKLRSVRLYWDHASLMKQVGVFELAFDGVIRTRGLAVFEHAMALLPIASGLTTARALMKPSAALTNHLMPLDQLPTVLKSQDELRYAPIGGIDRVGVLARDMDRLQTDEDALAVKKNHQISSVFDEQRAPVERPIKSTTAKTSLVFGQEEEESLVSVAKSSASLNKTFLIDEDAHCASGGGLKMRPGTSVDPNSNRGHGIFSQEFHQSAELDKSVRPLTDQSRFESHVFVSNGNAAASANDSVCHGARQGLDSHIFDNVDGENQSSSSSSSSSLSAVKRTSKSLSKEIGVQMQRPYEMEQTQQGSFMDPKCNRRINASHLKSSVFMGDAASLDPTQTQSPMHKRVDDRISSSFSEFYQDNSGNATRRIPSSSLAARFGETNPEPIKPSLGGGSNVGKHNRSQIVLGDDASVASPPSTESNSSETTSHRPSSRVLLPPGGKSSSIFG